MTTNILLIRHGQTESNRIHVNMGRSDEDLNDTGFKQIQLLSDRLRGIKIQSVFSSPLQRTLSTAGIVAGPHGLPVKVIQDLTEINFGEWQGLSREEIRQRWPELLQKWIEDPTQVNIPGGENFCEVGERSQRVLDSIISENPDGTVLVVTHEIIIKIMIMRVLETALVAYRRFEVHNGSLSRIQVREQGLRVVTVNDRSHLEGILLSF